MLRAFFHNKFLLALRTIVQFGCFNSAFFTYRANSFLLAFRTKINWKICFNTPKIYRLKNTPHSPAFFSYRKEHIRTSCQRSEEHTSELQSQFHLVCRLLLENIIGQPNFALSSRGAACVADSHCDLSVP